MGAAHDSFDGNRGNEICERNEQRANGGRRLEVLWRDALEKSGWRLLLSSALGHLCDGRPLRLHRTLEFFLRDGRHAQRGSFLVTRETGITRGLSAGNWGDAPPITNWWTCRLLRRYRAEQFPTAPDRAE